jgi:hypothetical protein
MIKGQIEDAEIACLRAEVERLTARLNFSKNDFEITKLQAALQGARSRGDEMAARAESAERKLAMARQIDFLGLALELETQATRVESQSVERAISAAARGLRLALTELEKADD